MISVYIGCDFFLWVFRNDYCILRGSEVKLTDIYSLDYPLTQVYLNSFNFSIRISAYFLFLGQIKNLIVFVLFICFCSSMLGEW